MSIILWGNSLSANCPRDNYLGDNFWGSNFRGEIVRVAIIGRQLSGEQLSRGQLSGGQLSGGLLSCSHLFSIVISTNIPWDQSFAGSRSNIKLSAKKSKFVQTNGQFNVQISLAFSCTSLYSTRTKTQQIDKNIIMQPCNLCCVYCVHEFIYLLPKR